MILVPYATDLVEKDVWQITLVKKVFSPLKFDPFVFLANFRGNREKVIQLHKRNTDVRRFRLDAEHQKQILVFVDLVSVVDAQNDVVGLPEVALKRGPSTVDLPQMLENSQSLIAISEFLVEFDEIVFQLFIFVAFFFELDAESLEEGVCEVDSVAPND